MCHCDCHYLLFNDRPDCIFPNQLNEYVCLNWPNCDNQIYLLKSTLLYIMHKPYPDWVLSKCTNISMYNIFDACDDHQVCSNDQILYVYTATLIINNIALGCIKTMPAETVVTIWQHSQLLLVATWLNQCWKYNGMERLNGE